MSIMAIAGEFPEKPLEEVLDEMSEEGEKKPENKPAKKAAKKKVAKSAKKPARKAPKAVKKPAKKTPKKKSKKPAKKAKKSAKSIATTSRSGKKIHRAVNGGKGKKQQGGRMALVVLVSPQLRARAWKVCKDRGMFMTAFLTKAIERACASR